MCGFSLLIYAVVKSIVQKLTENRRILRQRLSVCNTFEEFCRDFKKVPAHMPFFDFIHAALSISQQNSDWVYQRMLLYILIY